MPSINGKTYTKIVTTGAEIWDIVPFDNFGNAVSEMVIEADTTLGTLTLNLPAIFTFNNFSFLINQNLLFLQLKINLLLQVSINLFFFSVFLFFII